MHVMLDTETSGVSPTSVIRSIGAATFSLDDNPMPMSTFYRNIDRDSCLDAGLLEEKATMDFWSKQPEATQNTFLTPEPVQLAHALSDFFSWFREVGGKEVWAQGAAFDPVIVENAMKAVGILAPWKFWNLRDTRTVYQIAGLDYHSVPRTGIEHHALDDCFHQVKLVHASLQKLQGGGKENFR